MTVKDSVHKMCSLYLVIFLTAVLFEEVISEVSFSFCNSTTTDLFPFPGNCSRYVSCNQGQIKIFSCINGSTYNTEFNRCDYVQLRDNCQNYISYLKDSRISCPKGSSGNFPHPFDCKKFIACSFGAAYIMDCAAGTVYNSLSFNCDWRQNVSGCFGNLGNGDILRGDVMVSSINIGSMSFKTKKNVGNKHQINQLIDNEKKFVTNQNHGINELSPANNQLALHPVSYTNHFINETNYHKTEKKSNNSIQSGHAERNQQYNHQTNIGSHPQIVSSKNISASKPNYYQTEKPISYLIQTPIVNQYSSLNYQSTPNTPTIQIQSSNQPIKFPTENLGNREDENLDIDIRIKNNNLDERSISRLSTRATTPITWTQRKNLPIIFPTERSENSGNKKIVVNIRTKDNNLQNRSISKFTTGDATRSTSIRSSNLPIIFPTEKSANELNKNLEVNISMKDSESNHVFSANITRNGRMGTELSSDQILAINNLAELKKTFNNTDNKVEYPQHQNVSELNNASYLYSHTYAPNDDDRVGSPSEINARIVHFSNNFINSKPLEPIDNRINETNATVVDHNSQLVIFKDEIVSVPSTTFETPSTSVVENIPSINLLNYNYIQDYGNDSVQIDQNYSRIRNHFVKSDMNYNNVRQNRTIQKINHKPTGLRALFRENSQDDTFLSTLFVTPFKPESDDQHVEITNQFSGQVLRLRGGSEAHQGYVEIRGIGLVGQCNDNWDLKIANKTCKRLGYKRGAKKVWKGQTNDVKIPLLSLESDVFFQDEKSEFQIFKFHNFSECSTENDTIGVECALDLPVYCSENNLPFHGNCYHLVNSSLDLNHEDAIQYCSSRNSSLLYITSQNENDFISEWLTQKYPQVESVMTAGIGFAMMGQNIWIWQDSAKSLFKFMKWWPGWKNEKILPPSVKSSASCIVMKNKFPCYDQPSLNCKTDGYFFWDVEDCTSSMNKNHYICKRAYNNIIL